MGRLLREPHLFGFDAAMRVLMRKAHVTDPARSARFASDAALAFPGTEISEVRPTEPDPTRMRSTGVRSTEVREAGVRQAGVDGDAARAPAEQREQASTPAANRLPRVKVPLIGLVGAAGVLPRLYGTTAMSSARRGSTALQDFLDLLSHRLVAFFGSAGIKYRLHRSTEVAALAKPPARDSIAAALLALTGHAAPGLTERLAIGPDPLLHYAGLFSMRPRSADRLQALVSDWLGRPVEVRQFAGSWLLLPRDEQTSLPLGGSPGTWNSLGLDAAIGVQSWDIQARIVLRIGPLEREAFEALLPDGPVHARLVSLVRTFLGLETGVAINPVLAREAGFPLDLGESGKPLLGWNTWLAEPGHPLREDALDAVFEMG
jgi:type VI secretion system protein ImpH